MSALIRRTALAALLAYLLLFHGLTGAGLLGPDEPRYAAIGREMATSGDWVTPRLWGEPWFEKPVLLYWLTASGFRLGLGDDLAPRLPVALLSLAFLLFYWRRLTVEFGPRAGHYATAMLASSAGWLGFSGVAVTDLPLAASFGAAWLFGLGWLRTGQRLALCAVGGFLGLAVLAKGLVPLVLALPALWFGRRLWRQWWIALASLLAVAAPWYVLCAWRNGEVFLQEFIWKHHVLRFQSEVIQHVQPWWFFIPVLVAGLFPWTPLLALAPRQAVSNDQRKRLLGVLVVFGLVFFSASINKLPGYLLPLLPPLCALAGLGLAETRRAHWHLALTAGLLLLVPPLAAILPVALRDGLTRSTWPGFPWGAAGLALALALAVWLVERNRQRDRAVMLLLTGIAVSVVYLKTAVLPVLDENVSARSLWRRISPVSESVCVEWLHRSWRYGLNYYSVRPLPDCADERRPLKVTDSAGGLPVIEESE